MDDEAERAPAGGGAAATTPGRRRTAPWFRIVLFAAGVLVGVLVVGLLDVTTPDFAATGTPGGTPTGSAQPGAGPTVTPGAEARVNAACLGVLNEAQDVYEALGGLGQAVDDVDLTALDDIVRRLQPIEPRLGQDLRDCRVDTSVSSGSTPAAATPLPRAPSVPATPQPSATR